MDDLISRQAAIDALHMHLMYRMGTDSNKKRLDEWINNLPSVQPEITHCAECIHWKHSDVRKNYCEVFDWVNEAEDFCSFAERRTDEGD